MYRLGGIYQYGFPQLGVPVYYQQAAEWLKKAEWFMETVEQGDASVCQIPTGYSNAYPGANRVIRNACSENEFEMFRMRNTGGRYAVTGLALDASHIELQESLTEYLDELPTQKEISGHKVEGNKWLPIKRKEKE